MAEAALLLRADQDPAELLREVADMAAQWPEVRDAILPQCSRYAPQWGRRARTHWAFLIYPKSARTKWAYLGYLQLAQPKVPVYAEMTVADFRNNDPPP